MENIISRIVKRADLLDIIQATRDPRFTLYMDLTESNKVIPMDFERMYMADNANFAHDIIGIQRHFNRVTRQMDDFFLPRFAKPEEVK